MIGVIIAIPVFVLVLTDCHWSGFMGSKIAGMMDTNGDLGQGELAINPPNQIERITLGLHVKQTASFIRKGSSGHHGNAAMPQTKLDYQISIDKVVEQAQKSGIKKPFSIEYIQVIKMVPLLYLTPSNSGVTGLDVSPYKEQTLYFDQHIAAKS